jgi:uncharacterized membrane protein required for colicin V production
MISKIDIAILVFMTYHIIRGYSAGFSKSLFLSIRFIVSIILTRFIYINFADEIITSVFYERYQLIMHELITKIISVFWYQALDLDPKVLAVSLFIVVSILINIVFYTLHSFFNKKSLKWIDKNLGLAFGLFKSILYIMILVALIDPIIQKQMGSEIHELLTNTRLLKYFYSYNFIFDIFTKL